MIKILFNSLLLVYIIASSCAEHQKGKESFSYEGVSTNHIDSLEYREEIFYGFYADNSSKRINQIRCFQRDTLFLDIIYNNNTIKDIRVLNIERVKKIKPSLLYELGSELFLSNCYSCHSSLPDADDNSLYFLTENLYKKNELFNYLHNRQLIDEKLQFYHPDFSYLDSFEIKSILGYLAVDTGLVN